MASNTSNFVVPLPPVVKVEVEEQVVPKDFRGYLTRALAWTALMPLFTRVWQNLVNKKLSTL